MKIIYLWCALSISACLTNVASAQKWVTLMQNPNTNFYTVQKEFNKNWLNKQNEIAKERKSGVATDESGVIKEEVEDGYMPYKRWEYFMEPRSYPTGKRINPSIAADEYQK